MIEKDIKRIREAENNALSRIEKAEKESKERVEVAKKEIRKNIEKKREELLNLIAEWKSNAEKEGMEEADKILAEYNEKVKNIENIDKSKIKEVSIEVLKEIFG